MLIEKQQELLDAVNSQVTAGTCDAHKAAKKRKQIEKITKQGLKDLKRNAREASGGGRKAPKREAQEALGLKEKTYGKPIARFTTSKVARDVLWLAADDWITPKAGVRGSNGIRSHHGTNTLSFLVSAKSLTSPAVVRQAEEDEVELASFEGDLLLETDEEGGGEEEETKVLADQDLLDALALLGVSKNTASKWTNHGDEATMELLKGIGFATLKRLCFKLCKDVVIPTPLSKERLAWSLLMTIVSDN